MNAEWCHCKHLTPDIDSFRHQRTARNKVLQSNAPFLCALKSSFGLILCDDVALGTEKAIRIQQ